MKATILTVVIWLLPVPCLADAPSSEEVSPTNNLSKTEHFLPGEEVVTETGKKVKVWSTRGPVKVSPPPQPFDDPRKGYIDGANIIVDERSGSAIKRNDREEFAIPTQSR